MRRARAGILAATIGLLTAIAPAAATAAPPGLPVQLSLGDSWATGVGAPAGEGYVDVLHRRLRTDLDCSPARSPRAAGGCRQLQLENLGGGGATTTSLIAQQLPAAIALLEDRNGDRNPRNDVEVVTLHIGGNDVTNPILQACAGGGLTPTCQQTVATSFAGYATRLDRILGDLRAAAGPDTPIVLGTYDNPLPSCDLGVASPGTAVLGDTVLAGTAGFPSPLDVGLRGVMTQVAATHDVLVADVFGELVDGDDWVGGSDCLHPVASGYEKVAATFVEALGLG